MWNPVKNLRHIKLEPLPRGWMEGDKRTSCQVALVGTLPYNCSGFALVCVATLPLSSILPLSGIAKFSSKHFHIVAGSSTRCLSVTSDRRAPTVTNHCVFELLELDTAAAASESGTLLYYIAILLYMYYIDQPLCVRAARARHCAAWARHCAAAASESVSCGIRTTCLNWL